MAEGIRFIAQHYNTETDEILESITFREDILKKPTYLKELGYEHTEQIKLIQSIQDFKIKHDAVYINTDPVCPQCGAKASPHGIRKSKFHAVFTDHEVYIQRRTCKCGWSSPYTIESIYGSSMHPDLLEKQAIQGAENSYRQASKHLNAESASNRRINNDDRIRKSVAKVGEVVGQQKLKTLKATKKAKATKQLIAVVDGGHVKSKVNDTRSFEAMTATVYSPDNLCKIDKYHNEITKKTSVASALSDEQKTIKQLILNACRKEGMNSGITELTCLTDGASNCWSITKTLKPYCKQLINVLDWFHITKRFTVINNSINADFKDRLEKVKWHLWHGNHKKGLERLKSLINEIQDEKVKEKLNDLYEYIDRNKKYLINYKERQAAGLPFTSTLAEVTVNSLINIRQKRNQKMQWSRIGSHNILQIKTSLFSQSWESDWLMAQKDIYKEAA